MANKLYEETYIQKAADAIRTKSHRTNKFTVAAFESEINSIPQNTCRINSPFALGYSNLDNAWEAVKAAMSYWNAKNSLSKYFDYQDGCGPLKMYRETGYAKLHNPDGYVVDGQDLSGYGVIDCSTFVGLVLRGISYMESPYYTSTATTIDPRTVMCLDKSWTEKYFELQDYKYDGQLVFPTYDYKTTNNKYRVLTASDIAQYYDKIGLFWYADDISITPRAGDICFFYKENENGALEYPTRFHGISHIGIMTDKDFYLNATSVNKDVQGIVRTAVSSRPPFAYARPYYGAFTDGSAEQLTLNKVDLIPDVWSGLKQGITNHANDSTFTLEGKELSFTGQGTNSEHSVLSSSCPLVLPAGTYKLSGVEWQSTLANATGNHSVWGLRVYTSSGDNIVNGKFWSSNGTVVHYTTDENSKNDTICDLGGGAEFTLTKETAITIKLFLNASKTFNNFKVTPKLIKIG